MNTAAAIARLAAVVSPPPHSTPFPFSSYPLAIACGRYESSWPGSGPHPAIDNDDVYVVFCLRAALYAKYRDIGHRKGRDYWRGRARGHCIWHLRHNILLHCSQHISKKCQALVVPAVPVLVSVSVSVTVSGAATLATFCEFMCALWRVQWQPS